MFICWDTKAFGTILNVASAQHPLVGSGVKKLMYSHDTEQPCRSWYLILNVFKLVNQSFHSLITTELMVFSH